MKARNIMIAAALAALTLLSAGCKKHDWRPVPGTPITFKIKSNMVNPVETKKVYNNNGGAYFTIDGDKFEGIDWEIGDKLSIGYVSAEDGTPVADVAEYQISEILSNAVITSDNMVVSTGKAVPAAEGLFWHGGNYHEFYTTTLPPDFDVTDKTSYKFEMKYDENLEDYYPDSYLPYYYPYSFSASDPDFMTKSEADGSYCENMQYAYIYSINNGRKVPQYGDINLTTTPHFTAFEITAQAKKNDLIAVNSFTLSCGNAFIAGEIPYVSYVDSRQNSSTGEYEYDWKWTNVDDDASLDQSSKVKIDFSEEEIVLYNDGTVSNQLKFTFFVKDVRMNHLTLTFNIKKGEQNVNRSLRLTYASDGQNDWIPFGSSYKHRIYGLQIPLEASGAWFEGTDAGGYDQIDWNL